MLAGYKTIKQDLYFKKCSKKNSKAFGRFLLAVEKLECLIIQTAFIISDDYTFR